MKNKRFHIIFKAILCTGILFSCKGPSEQFPVRNVDFPDLKGDVESIKEIHKYDPKGWIPVYIHKFDSLGNHIKTDYYHSYWMVATQESTFKEKELTKRVYKDLTTNKSDSTGFTVENGMHKKYHNGVLEESYKYKGKKVYVLNPEGRICAIREYDSLGQCLRDRSDTSEVSFVRDTCGRITKSVSHAKKGGTTTTKYEYTTYDDKGNWTLRQEVTEKGYDNPVKREITYRVKKESQVK